MTGEQLTHDPVDVVPPGTEPAASGSGHRKRRAALESARRRLAALPGWVSVAFAAGFYLAFAIYLTWPLVGDLGDRIYGAVGDLTGGIAYYRELAQDGLNPFLPGEIRDFNAPAGYPVRWDLGVATVPSTSALMLLTYAIGPIPAMGVYTLAGYTLSGLALFLLARRLSGNAWVALLAGWAFAFYPFAVVNGQGHTDYIHGWVLVPLVWRMFELWERPTVRNGVSAGAAAVLAFWWTPYFLLIGGVAFGALAFGGLVRSLIGRRLRAALVPFAAACAIAGGFILALLAVTSGAETSSVREHSIDAIFTYSARPHEYVVPAATHPVFGETTRPFLEDRLHGSNFSENTLYVGVSLILLSLVALGAALLGRLEGRTRAAALGLGLVVVTALAFSAPPKTTVFSQTIDLPSSWVYELTATWRVFARFVVLVMLGVALLGAIGLAFLMRGRSPAMRVAILLLGAAIVTFDLWGRLGGRINVIEAPDVYAQLERMPSGIAAEYPLLPSGEGNYGDLFYQEWHGKPLLNGFAEDSDDEKRALWLSDLSEPSTAAGLATLGVDYVIDRAERPPGHPFAGKHPRRGDFERIGGDAYATLYRVPRVRGAVATGLAGFDSPEGEPGKIHQWLLKPAGELELRGTCEPCTGRLVFSAQSFAVPRVLTIRDQEGRVLLRRRVMGEKRFSVPVSFSGRTTLGVEATPGPQPVAEQVPGSGDPRSVSLQIFEPRVALDPEGRRR